MITVREIIATTALRLGLEPIELVADSRDRRTVLARHVAMHVARKTTQCSTSEIGRAFNERDHSTVSYALEKIAREIGRDAQLAGLVGELMDTVAFLERVRAHGSVDALAVARRIAGAPQRQAMAASVMEIAALAATTVELWEIARAADEAARLYSRRAELRRRGILDLDKDEMAEARSIDERLGALNAAIADEIAALCADPSTSSGSMNRNCTV
ncbi:helix-turn-helix domain-containing protein [Nitratireductor soli]|uniref:helix-turn-helix domain-containing protein n=1 Tax=Nitratireductor soli TaxID=1670619 RepID=UPI00065E1F37|nr:helix-turn-helix domain-containing protein [Nitratireductor soli]